MHIKTEYNVLCLINIFAMKNNGSWLHIYEQKFLNAVKLWIVVGREKEWKRDMQLSRR